ncbi:hypothetical protein QYE76_072046 [Lolium multiflorum]|uniref:Uncharacterized protein n=1 Tax=Lolium multiflorum TaxID=4521 RepID=A0AAD8PSV2_LOLMU|nr:hypothetical protein QYE76_072046 [Lolium multiflorum]
MYLETLEKMNLTKEQLKHSTTEFHGVVRAFKSSYHVIFGRPTYHKFHAVACYIYNKLKIPGPNGEVKDYAMKLGSGLTLHPWPIHNLTDKVFTPPWTEKHCPLDLSPGVLARRRYIFLALFFFFESEGLGFLLGSILGAGPGKLSSGFRRSGFRVTLFLKFGFKGLVRWENHLVVEFFVTDPPRNAGVIATYCI